MRYLENATISRAPRTLGSADLHQTAAFAACRTGTAAAAVSLTRPCWSGACSAAGTSLTTILRLNSRIDALIGHLGSDDMAWVTAREVEAYFDGFRTPTMVKDHTIALQAVFAAAHKRELITRNPVIGSDQWSQSSYARAERCYEKVTGVFEKIT
jgi:hypothetical protein